jgi:formimidoylglutamate deiminase
MASNTFGGSMRLIADSALLPGGWARNVQIDIDDSGRIAAVEPDVVEARAGERLRDRILLPAPANLHSHAFQRALAGLTERRGPGEADSFWTWRDLMYSFLNRLTPDDVEAIAALAFMEMLESGFASAGEFHYIHNAPGGTPYADAAEMPVRIAQAARETGIGLTLLPVLYMQGGVNGRPLAEGQTRFANTLDGFARLLEGAEKAAGKLPDASVGVAPHSLRAVPPDALAEAAELRPGAPMHIHIAEQEAEVREIEAAYGARPVAWLLDSMQVDERWCLVHATHMTDTEIIGLAASGAVAGLCPVTEANLGDGLFEGVKYLGAGGVFGIGTDSNVRIGLADEMRLLEYGQRLHNRGRAMLCPRTSSNGRTLFDAVCKGGAQALGRNSGHIAPGTWADLLTLDGAAIALDGLQDDGVLDAWIFAGREPLIRDVWSAGRHVVMEGRHVARDMIEPRARKVLRSLRERPE